MVSIHVNRFFYESKLLVLSILVKLTFRGKMRGCLLYLDLQIGEEKQKKKHLTGHRAPRRGESFR